MAKGTSKGGNSVTLSAQQPTPQPKKPAFVPATSIKEAEDFISQYLHPNAKQKYIMPTGVSYAGVSLEVANEVNKTLSELFDEYGEMFGGVIAPAGNTKLGRMISGAVAAYHPLMRSFLLNRQVLKDGKTAAKYFANEGKTQDNIYKNPQNYDFSKARKSFLTLYNNGKQSGRMTVPRSVGEALTHEFGHRLEGQVKRSANWDNVEKRMATYAPRVSGYACQDKSEYIAESFCSWKKGENKADPELIKIFKSLRK